MCNTSTNEDDTRMLVLYFLLNLYTGTGCAIRVRTSTGTRKLVLPVVFLAIPKSILLR